MTDPVSGIGGTKATSSGGTYSGGSFADEHKKRESHAPEHDLVEISQDARDRSSGKKRKSITEYLRELLS
ncbi:MAG: hypothetical protein H7Y05_11235 [Steroidobacteraceae bacterium]|nr:hypothetical protein [Deltaproteobacteria bacterium]